jgi:undecaprenyl-diphosphatase
VIKAYVTEYDLRIFRAIYFFRRNSFLPVFFRVISFIGDGYFYFIFLVYLYLNHRGTFLSALYVFLIAFAIELPIYHLMKHSIRRVRPFNAHEDISNMVLPIDEYSFPSGHTSAAFMMALIISSFVPVLTVYVYVFAVLIGFARIYIGVHYPSDILGGAVFGSSCGLASLYLVNQIS